jgi:hypothetical protein
MGCNGGRVGHVICHLPGTPKIHCFWLANSSTIRVRANPVVAIAGPDAFAAGAADDDHHGAYTAGAGLLPACNRCGDESAGILRSACGVCHEVFYCDETDCLSADRNNHRPACAQVQGILADHKEMSLAAINSEFCGHKALAPLRLRVSTCRTVHEVTVVQEAEFAWRLSRSERGGNVVR